MLIFSRQNIKVMLKLRKGSDKMINNKLTTSKYEGAFLLKNKEDIRVKQKNTRIILCK